jgi:hypothetical protein
MGGRVRVERDDLDPRLGWIVFDHPERRNAISVEMWREIPLAVEQLAADASIRVVLLRGAGEAAFVAGADISEFGDKRSSASAADYDVDGARAFAALAALAKPVIAWCAASSWRRAGDRAVRRPPLSGQDDAIFAIPAAQLGVGYHGRDRDARISWSCARGDLSPRGATPLTRRSRSDSPSRDPGGGLCARARDRAPDRRRAARSRA